MEFLILNLETFLQVPNYLLINSFKELVPMITNTYIFKTSYGLPGCNLTLRSLN